MAVTGAVGPIEYPPQEFEGQESEENPVSEEQSACGALAESCEQSRGSRFLNAGRHQTILLGHSDQSKMIASISGPHKDDARVSNSVPDGARSAKDTMSVGGSEPARTGASGMRILFLSPRLCAPQVTGARLREYHLARALGGHAEVTYVSFLPAGLEPPSPADLPFFSEIHVTPLVERNNPLNIMRGLVGGWPLPVLNYTSAKMKATLASIAARQRFDLVHIDSFVMAAYAPFLGSVLPGPVRVAYDWHNIGSELMRRMASSMSSIPRKVYARITASRLGSMERRMLRSGFGHVVCSEREREQFIGMEPGARIAVIENGVDPERFASSHSVDRRQRLLFVGTMNYSPNSEAAIRFARRVWPRIRERFPGLRLTIVGSNPGPAVLALRDQPGVEVTGTVPEVAPFYREAFAAVVPLRTGGGTRLKILEAMAAGVPVLSTSLGAEGLAVSPGKDILIVDDDEGWVRALIGLSESERSCDDLAAAGRDLVRSRYDWRVLGERLYETYRQWLASVVESSAAR